MLLWYTQYIKIGVSINENDTIFLDVQEINWKSWLDGVAIGVLLQAFFCLDNEEAKQWVI